MAPKWIGLVTGSLEQKKQYKQYKARIEALPEPYGTVAKALQRYFMYYGGVTDGETALKMFGDFADLWERAAADGTPVRAIWATTRSSSTVVPRPASSLTLIPPCISMKSRTAV
jgi:DNA-binding ferritin-like protein (Dps family)